MINELCEEYTAEVGETPDSRELQRLANEILREDLTDKRSNKVQEDEYSFLSDTQKKRRKFGVHQRKGKYEVGEVPLKHLEGFDLDGNLHRGTNRVHKSIGDMVTIDINSRPFDEHTRKQYEKFIKPGKVFTYDMKDGRWRV